MDQTQDLSLCANPSYVVQKNKNIETEYCYVESDVSSDKPVYTETQPSNQSVQSINTKNIKPTNGRKRRCLPMIVLSIATTSMMLSVAALVLSLWSAFTPSTTSQGTAGVLQQNQMLVTLEQLNQKFATLDQLNQTALVLDQLSQIFVTLDQLEEVRNASFALENAIQNLSIAVQIRPELGPDINTLIRIENLEAENSSIISDINDFWQLVQQLNDSLLILGYSIENVNNSLLELRTVVNVDVNSMLSNHENSIDDLSNDVQMLNSVITMESARVNNLIGSNADSIETVSDNLQTLTDFLSLRPISACGPGNWRRVAYVNMAISSQQCPSAWREYTSPVRSCGRPSTSSGSCPSTIFGTYGVTYNRVCGRATGYQYGTTDAYAVNDIPNPRQVMSVDDNYVDGVSVARGNSHTHIWTFAAGSSVRSSNPFACRCDNPSADRSPSFVGNSYFCESSATSDSSVGTFYTNNRLWDGSGCVGGTCCTFNSPPWFNVQLPSSTTDDIEVRICGDEDTDNEDTPIRLLEIYVQ